jgi:hypothetical protein
MIIVRHPGRACLGPPQEPGLADVRLYMDGRERTAEGDEVVEAVDLVRRRVVLPTGAEEPVLDANFFVLLSGPAQFLIDIADGYERAVDWCNTLPSSPTGLCGRSYRCLGRHSYVLSCSSCS